MCYLQQGKDAGLGWVSDIKRSRCFNNSVSLTLNNACSLSNLSDAVFSMCSRSQWCSKTMMLNIRQFFSQSIKCKVCIWCQNAVHLKQKYAACQTRRSSPEVAHLQMHCFWLKKKNTEVNLIDKLNYTPAVKLPARFGCRTSGNPVSYTNTVGVRGLEALR